MNLTERDVEIIKLICSCRLLSAKQIQTALFPSHHDSRCQLRLTLLKTNKYIDAIPNRLVNQPAIYMISRKCRNAFDILREYWSDEQIKSYMIAPGSLAHLLAINDIRVRVLRACKELDVTLAEWNTSEDLAVVLADEGIIPDAYFKIQRRVEGEVRTSGFFLELQHANRSRMVIQSKLKRYAHLYESGSYQESFGTRALRLLMVFTSSYGTNVNHRITTSLQLAREMNIGLLRSASLETIKTLQAHEILTGKIWYHPSQDDLTALY